MEPVKGTCIGNKTGAFRLEDLPNRLVPVCDESAMMLAGRRLFGPRFRKP